MMPIGLLLWMKRKRDGYQPKKASRLAGITRVVAYGVGAATLVGACSFHSAKADMAEGAIAIGRELKPLQDLFKETNQIVLNGQPVFVSTAPTKQSMTTVLDRFETYCKSNNPAFSNMWKEIPKLDTLPEDQRKNFGSDLGVVRKQNAKEGSVMCLVRENGAPGIMGSLKEFTKSHDLSNLGKLRYAYVTADRNGGSFVMTAWTEGKFDMSKLVPSDGGDAYGSDSTDYPRPPSSKRYLTANLAKTPYGVRIYSSDADPKAVVDFYDQQMDDTGWAVISPPNAGDGGRVYSKGQVNVVLASGKNQQGRTVVSLAEMGIAPEKGVLPQTVTTP